ncbi:DNA repair protein RecN [Texcoconibacillus texcoconensis]|uniref:DNA repair protein RecN n=1 Tax=Texcoconibacillus texcoconensis TaxID=1095777 RepID=A0A840QNY9_9BACI|nr:DNA repair protein RecN [Texcoconibacillus texcoconensis]MBB5173061.1 DNA repair protein RecN (Recombination protein N) [Texcoconibacillus texcoconensis]
MLLELSIKDFAIIEDVSISFDDGLSVLTGETGAGKSIIIDAIGLLIGGRGSVEFVRHGAKRAEIEGIFSLDRCEGVTNKLLELGVDPGEEDTLVLQRHITLQGKSVCRANGKLVTLAILREIGQSLVDIHGQHEHQHLMQTDKHLRLLDRFGGEKLLKAKQEYKDVYERFQKAKNQLKRLSENEQQTAQRLDLIQYQLQEIEQASLQLDEDDTLEKERAKLANSEKLYEQIQSSYNALYGDSKGLEWIFLALQNLEDVKHLDEGLTEIYNTLQNEYYMLEEATFSLREHLDTLEFDPERLHEIEGRLSEIHQLKRKYGSSVNEILEYASTIEEEVDTLEHRDHHIQKWQQEVQSASEDLYVEAQNVSKLRRQAAEKLQKAVQSELQALFMKDTVVEVHFQSLTPSDDDPYINGEKIHFNEDGFERVEFYVATNKGEPLKPLAKVASGGEISRLILAFKTVLSSFEGVTTLIFDEVDTGVSGRVSQAIAEKIQKMSADAQVLCITHLPQVAAMADTHLYISKQEEENRVVTNVRTLSVDEAVDELSRMISGVEITDLTKKHADELLQQANQIKQL